MNVKEVHRFHSEMEFHILSYFFFKLINENLIKKDILFVIQLGGERDIEIVSSPHLICKSNRILL